MTALPDRREHPLGPVSTTDPAPLKQNVLLGIFMGAPFIAFLAAIPLLWGRGIGWLDLTLFLVFYVFTGLGVTVGFHRYFTHSSFKAKRWLKIGLGIAGSMSVEGSVIQWVAEHRRHHQFSDQENDPHSPWLYGDRARDLARGLIHAHIGWMFGSERTNQRRFAADLIADRDIKRVSRLFILWVAISLFVPPAIGGLVTHSWSGAFTAFFWGSLVRIGLLHHATWAINSICHVFGERPFRSGDKAANVWWLAILSFGESWHNLHHADPTCARHGVEKGQIDISARVIRIFEMLGWARNVKWPRMDRLEAKRAGDEPTAA